MRMIHHDRCLPFHHNEKCNDFVIVCLGDKWLLIILIIILFFHFYFSFFNGLPCSIVPYTVGAWSFILNSKVNWKKKILFLLLLNSIHMSPESRGQMLFRMFLTCNNFGHAIRTQLNTTTTTKYTIWWILSFYLYLVCALTW